MTNILESIYRKCAGDFLTDMWLHLSPDKIKDRYCERNHLDPAVWENRLKCFDRPDAQAQREYNASRVVMLLILRRRKRHDPKYIINL